MEEQTIWLVRSLQGLRGDKRSAREECRWDVREGVGELESGSFPSSVYGLTIQCL